MQNLMLGLQALHARLDGMNERLVDVEGQVWEIKESLAAEDEDDNDDSMSP